jgi:queuosine precursor transporter
MSPLPLIERQRAFALCVAYLAAIVAANLSVAHWGPTAAVYNAFLFIGLDLTTRDALHDLWRGRLIRNMALLIATGSALSYLLGLALGTGPDVGRIALASCIAFGAAATADAVAYHWLRDRPWYERANQSNIAGAAVDSLVFVALWPFGFQFTLAFTLFAAKVAGGVVWSFLLAKGADGRAWLGHNRERYAA